MTTVAHGTEPERCSKVGRVQGASGHEIYKPRQINYRSHWERETTGEALFPLENNPARHSRRGISLGSTWIDGSRSTAKNTPEDTPKELRSRGSSAGKPLLEAGSPAKARVLRDATLLGQADTWSCSSA